MMHYETIVQGVLLPTLQLREQRRQVARHATYLPRRSNEQPTARAPGHPGWEGMDHDPTEEDKRRE